MAIGTANNYRQTQTSDKINTAHHWGEAISALEQAKSGYAPSRMKGITDLMTAIAALFG